MTTLTTIAKWVYALCVAVFGIVHFVYGSDLVIYVPGFIPGGVFWVYLTGAAFLAASISIITGFYTRLACLLLGSMFIIFVATVHIPSVVSGNSGSISTVANDLALAAGALFLAVISDNKTLTDLLQKTMRKKKETNTKQHNYEKIT